MTGEKKPLVTEEYLGYMLQKMEEIADNTANIQYILEQVFKR